MKKLLSTMTIFSLAIGLSVAPALAEQMAPQKFNAHLVRSSKVIGADVFNTTGKDIGKVNDIVFDENTGGMMHAVLEAGGFIGIGDRLTPVSWQSMQVKENAQNTDTFQLVTTLDKAKLTEGMSFERNLFTATDKSWMKQIPAANGKKFVRASEVDDAKVFDRNGNHIGEIHEVIFDTQTGKVAYAAVSFEDEFLHKGEQMTMVPWTMLRQSTKTTPGFVLKADKTKLEGATFFAPNVWPNMNDFAWNKRVYDYYTVTPYFWTGV